MSRIHVLHENDVWSTPLFEALSARGAAWQSWHLADGLVDLTRGPEPGVYYNRMSASSHTRGHRYAPELTAATLAWLEGHGARVVNGSGALTLELSKVAQYQALTRVGVRTPATVAAVGRAQILEAAARIGTPFVTKHNRAGKGLGVRLFHTLDELNRHLDSDDFEPSVDGITLIQRYIESPSAHVTRVEFIGGRFLYAVRVDTSNGFELCPADACAIGDATCPVGSEARHAFEIVDGFDHALIARYEALLATHGIEVAAFEFVVDAEGRDYTYDINTNTNYNPEAERRAGVRAMDRLAAFLIREEHAQQRAKHAA